MFCFVLDLQPAVLRGHAWLCTQIHFWQARDYGKPGIKPGLNSGSQTPYLLCYQSCLPFMVTKTHSFSKCVDWHDCAFSLVASIILLFYSFFVYVYHTSQYSRISSTSVLRDHFWQGLGEQKGLPGFKLSLDLHLTRYFG